MKRYPNVVRAISERPWAILESTLQTIVDLVGLYADGGQLSREQVEARIAAGPGQGGSVDVAGGVAVIPISGVIMPRASLFSDISGGTSVEGLRNSFRAALDDDRVRAIVFDVDSPGGTVDLVPELAADIREARGLKPMVAQANTLMASAAYWLGAQADEVFVTPSGTVGSIGVFGVHTDQSAADEKAGLKTTLISAGKYKAEGNPHEPLAPEARAHLQGIVDSTYDLFVNDVADARGTTPDAVRAGYGQGRVLEPNAALRAGLVDGVQTFETTVSDLMRGAAPAPDSASNASGGRLEVTVGSLPRMPRSLVDDVEAARVAAAAVVARIEPLREVRDGKLSLAKREALQTLGSELLKLEDRIAQLLNAPAPDAQTASHLGLEAESRFAEMQARLKLT